MSESDHMLLSLPTWCFMPSQPLRLDQGDMLYNLVNILKALKTNIINCYGVEEDWEKKNTSCEWITHKTHKH